MSRIPALAVLTAAAVLSLAPTSLLAQDASQFSSGTTSLTLDTTLTAGLATDGVTVTAASPATLAGSTATFPVATGGLDLDTLIGVLYHSGGLTFTSTSTVVTVSQFAILDEGGNSQPLVYALVATNGKTNGLFPVFDITGKVALPLTAPTVNITGLSLTLSAEGASLLNSAFATTTFTAGEAVGTASITGTVSGYTSATVKKQPIE
jgi:hypothetical protein